LYGNHSHDNHTEMKGTCISPSEIIFTPLFLIAGRALSIANVVVIAKAGTTNNFKGASR
jgi:hypothetical protein